MTTEERIKYTKEFLNIDSLPEPMCAMILNGLEGLQDHTVDYQCGYCGTYVAGIVVARNFSRAVKWLGCPSCAKGSVSNQGTIVPAPLLGEDVKGLPDIIKSAYEEARKSLSSQSYTACEIMCRKILMNVAVHKGAPVNKKFVEYVDYLNDNRYIPVMMEPGVKQVKDNGNEAAHEIKQPDRKRASTTLQFTTLLLKSVYETEELMKGGSATNDNNDEDSTRHFPWRGGS